MKENEVVIHKLEKDMPEKCAVCVWSWGNAVGEWWCKLGLDTEGCEGPKEQE